MLGIVDPYRAGSRPARRVLPLQRHANRVRARCHCAARVRTDESCVQQCTPRPPVICLGRRALARQDNDEEIRMRTSPPSALRVTAALAALWLSACGGGGDGASPTTSAPAPISASFDVFTAAI